MLRLVSLAGAALLSVVVLAEEGQGGMTTYREPKTAELQRQQTNADEQLQKGEGYFYSQAFKDSLSSDRAKIYQVPDNLPGNRLDMPEGALSQNWSDRFNELETQANKAVTATPKSDMPLMIFASLSMPTETLKELAADAHRVGGVVVFRGLKNDDFIEMRKELAMLGEGFAIDPTLFTRFGITEVPTFVLPLEALMACEVDGCPPVRHIRVSGNVRLEGALDYMRINSREVGASDAANALMARMKDL